MEWIQFLSKEGITAATLFGTMFYFLYLFYKSSEKRLDKLFEDKQALFEQLITSEETRFEKLMEKHAEEETRRYKALEKMIETQQMSIAILARIELKVDSLIQKTDDFSHRVNSLHIETLKALHK